MRYAACFDSNCTPPTPDQPLVALAYGDGLLVRPGTVEDFKHSPTIGLENGGKFAGNFETRGGKKE